jgi:CDP-glycerol glycerophosphotransferase
VAARGSLDDIALLQDHLADHPHGLPTEPAGVLAMLPDGLVTPPDPWRQVAAVDRRLHSRVRLVPGGPGLVELRGAAFVDHVLDGDLPLVRVGDRPVEVRRHTEPDLDAWAARAHEDRGGCGFSATLAPAQLDGSGPWTVTVETGGRLHRHVVHPPSDHTAAADVLLSGVRLEGDELCADVRTAGPCRLRLVGRVQLEAVPDGGVLRLPLTVGEYGERALLPAGRYALEAWREDGGRSTVEVTELVEGPVEVPGERVRLELRRAAAGLVVVVGSPPGLPDRSARGQQRLLNGYRAGRATRAPTVLLETFRGRSAGDNPGAIGRALLAFEGAAGLDLAVVVDDPSVVVPEGMRAVPRRTRAWYDALAHAGAYVSNAGAPYWFEKSPGQLHVQTWHGTPLKRIGEDRGPGDFATWRHRRRIADQARGWDAMVSPSRYVTDIYRSAFGYAGTVLEVGYPRNDVLLAPDADVLRERVRARLGIGDEDRVVLYAPTWRQYVGVRDAKPLHLDAEALVRAMPDAVVLVRGHYNSTTEDDVFVAHPRIHDVTRYPDIADLFLAADALVTDYSSVMFDFVLTDRPVVLLVPDLEQYRDVERGFYFDIEARSPGPLVTTTADVVDVLTGPDAASARRADFRSVFCPFEDGAASARVVEYCLDRLSATSSTERSP